MDSFLSILIRYRCCCQFFVGFLLLMEWLGGLSASVKCDTVYSFFALALFHWVNQLDWQLTQSQRRVTFFFLLSFGCSTLLVKHDNLIPVIGTSSNKAVDSLFFSYSILVVTFLILMISLFLLGSNKNWLIGLKYSLCSYHMFLLALDSRKKKKKKETDDL